MAEAGAQLQQAAAAEAGRQPQRPLRLGRATGRQAARRASCRKQIAASTALWGAQGPGRQEPGPPL